MLQCVAASCSVLQCAAVCCSVLQCVAVCCSVLSCVAVCCRVLPCVAVCCSMLFAGSFGKPTCKHDYHGLSCVPETTMYTPGLG